MLALTHELHVGGQGRLLVEDLISVGAISRHSSRGKTQSFSLEGRLLVVWVNRRFDKWCTLLCRSENGRKLQSHPEERYMTHS